MKKLLATRRPQHPGETTHSDQWTFTDKADCTYRDGCIVIRDVGADGTVDQPYMLVLPMGDYEAVKVIEGE